jgi:N-terminal region of glycosyl transferase group 7/N-terminal domain of galactosyltransferase
LSVTSSFAPTELTPGKRLLNQWWPSRRLRTDPLEDLRIDERYAPVSIANWKLIPPVARSVLARRVIRPLTFAAERRLTVVIPYRDRAHHLSQLLPELLAKLAEQDLSYRVLVVEQEAGALFNRGRLLNVGMQYSADSSDYFCLHDVDAVPIVANYLCPSQPLRLGNRMLNCAGERVHDSYYFSGAVCIRKEHAYAVNGFSNEYWGWGKEDDDFFFRLLLAGFLCYFDLQGTFRDLPNPLHQRVRRKPVAPPHVKRNRQRRSRLLRGLSDPADDGLRTLHFNVVERVQHSSYEHIRVRW